MPASNGFRVVPTVASGSRPPLSSPTRWCAARRAEGESVNVLANADEATLAWAEDSLKRALAGGQIRLVGYLEAVLEDVLFELELASPPPREIS